MFSYEKGFIVNEKGKVVNVNGGLDAENRNIEVTNKGSALSQQWDIIYADEYPEEPKKGELNKEYGLYVERPFYVVTAMSSHRYLEVIDNRVIVIK